MNNEIILYLPEESVGAGGFGERVFGGLEAMSERSSKVYTDSSIDGLNDLTPKRQVFPLSQHKSTLHSLRNLH